MKRFLRYMDLKNGKKQGARKWAEHTINVCKRRRRTYNRNSVKMIWKDKQELTTDWLVVEEHRVDGLKKRQMFFAAYMRILFGT